MRRPSLLRRLLRALFIVLVVGATLLATGFFVAGRYVLSPEGLELLVLPKLEDAIGRNITVVNVGIGLRGLTMTDVTVLEEPTFAAGGGTPFATADALRFGIDYAALLDRKIVIDELVFERPRIHIARNRAGHWNVDTLGSPIQRQSPIQREGTGATAKAAPTPTKPAGADSLDVRIDRITVHDGSLHLEDHRGARPLVLSTEDLAGTADYDRAHGRFAIRGNARLDTNAATATEIEFRANLDRYGHTADASIALGQLDLDGLVARLTSSSSPPPPTRDQEPAAAASHTTLHLTADTVLYHGVAFDDVVANVVMQNQKVTLEGASARTAGGLLGLSGEVDLGAKELVYRGKGEISSANLAVLTSALRTHAVDEMSGKVDLNVDFELHGNDGRALAASLLGSENGKGTPTGHVHAQGALELDEIDLLGMLSRRARTYDIDAEIGEDGTMAPKTIGPYRTGGLRAELAVHVGHVGLGAYPLGDVHANVVLADRHLDVSQLTAEFADGEMQAQASIDLGVPGLAYDGQVDLDAVSLAQVSAALPVPAWGSRGGVTNASFAFNGRGTDKKTFLAELAASGDISVREGYVVGSTIFHEIGEKTGVDGFDSFEIRDGGGELRIRDGRVYSRHLMLGNAEARLIASGSLGFDKTLDVDLLIGVGPDSHRRLLSRGILMPYSKDQRGWTNVPVILSGTFGHVQKTVPYEAYAGTAVHAVPDTAGRLVYEGSQATKKVLQAVLGGLEGASSGRAAYRGPRNLIRSRTSKNGAEDPNGVPPDPQ